MGIRYFLSFKKVDHFQERINLSITKNDRFSKKTYFFIYVFPLLRPKDRIAPVDLRSFLKIDGIDSIFFKIDLSITKTVDSIEKPMIEFPTLIESNIKTFFPKPCAVQKRKFKKVRFWYCGLKEFGSA